MKTARIQLPKLIGYCGPAVFGLLILAGILSAAVPPNLQTIILLVPVPLGTVLGLLYYFRVGHQVLEVDEKGFKLNTGKNHFQQYDWKNFKEASLHADQRGRINLRMYFERGGKYVEIPASATGANPYTMRNDVLEILKKSRA